MTVSLLAAAAPSVAAVPAVGASSSLRRRGWSRRHPTTSAMSATGEASGAASAAGQEGARRVVVCGGGVIGACTAYFLAAANVAGARAQVTVVERSSVACAASGKAGGFLALDWCDGGPLSALARASFRLHRSLALALDGPASYGYRPLDTLSLAFFPGGEGKGGATRSSSSSPSLPSWVDGPAAASPRAIGTTETTAQVHPRLFTRKLISVAEEEHGVEVVIGEVERVEVEGGRATGVLVRLEKGAPTFLRADAVVLALGPWSARSPLVSSLCGVSGLKAHSIVLRPENPDAITPHALFLSYVPSPGARALDPEVYPRPTGEVYICGMSRDAEVPDDPEEIAGDADAISMLHEIAGTVSSHLRTTAMRGEEGGGGGAQVVAEQACFLPCTEDSLPVIGQIPGVEGCYVATGHSCWGILNGPATGKAMAELILEGVSTTVELAPFSPARFLRRRGRRVGP